jgi:pathogenesis-related protein 1
MSRRWRVAQQQLRQILECPLGIQARQNSHAGDSLMKSKHWIAIVAGAVAVGVWGCSGSESTTPRGNGGNSAVGGADQTGGATLGEGGSLDVGGETATGGGLADTGGSPGFGGAQATGGRAATGGRRASGGTKAAGGVNATGGTTSTGDTSAGGSSTVNCTGTAGSATCPEGVSSMCGMVAAHNAVRAAVTDASTPLPPLVWDCTLAAFAQAYASTCPANHNPNRTVEGQTAGENMAFFSNSALQSPSAVVKLWADEKQYYTVSTNSCASGQVCGHYTQLVWRKTTAVGCGVATGCSGSWSQIWVCDYLPAGNYVGQAPY